MEKDTFIQALKDLKPLANERCFTPTTPIEDIGSLVQEYLKTLPAHIEVTERDYSSLVNCTASSLVKDEAIKLGLTTKYSIEALFSSYKKTFTQKDVDYIKRMSTMYCKTFAPTVTIPQIKELAKKAALEWWYALGPNKLPTTDDFLQYTMGDRVVAYIAARKVYKWQMVYTNFFPLDMDYIKEPLEEFFVNNYEREDLALKVDILKHFLDGSDPQSEISTIMTVITHKLAELVD